MKAAQTIELTNLIQEITQDKKKAERIVELFDEARNHKKETRSITLTKNDKLEIITTLDRHLIWLVGIMVALFSLAIALIKLT